MSAQDPHLPARSRPTLPALPQRARDAHKGVFGRVLIIGGSQGMAGAAALAGKAALRSGAGLVRVATASSCQPTVAQLEPCYTTIPLADDSEGRITLDALPVLRGEIEMADSVAIGPGLGQSSGLRHLVVEIYRSTRCPTVIDADALNALALAHQSDEATDTYGSARGPRLWTPHPGEYQRLTGVAGDEQRDHGVDFAEAHEITLLLKGADSLITDRGRRWHNQTGNPGMATGGAGDVLTGILAALVAQDLSTWDAARLGAHVHGLAGDLAATETGETSLIASDIVQWLSRAFRAAQQATR